MHNIEKYNTVISGEEFAADNGNAFDLILNVSDTASDQDLDFMKKPKVCWYPINELSNWGYSPFYWSKKLLDNALKTNKKILIHCHAGAHRSPCIFVAWMLSLHESHKSIAILMKDPSVMDMFKRDQNDGIIPDDLKIFYKHMDENPSFSLMGILGLMGHFHRFKH